MKPEPNYNKMIEEILTIVRSLSKRVEVADRLEQVAADTVEHLATFFKPERESDPETLKARAIARERIVAEAIRGIKRLEKERD